MVCETGSFTIHAPAKTTAQLDDASFYVPLEPVIVSVMGQGAQAVDDEQEEEHEEDSQEVERRYCALVPVHACARWTESSADVLTYRRIVSYG